MIFIKYLLFVAKISDFQIKRNADLVLTGIVLAGAAMTVPLIEYNMGSFTRDGLPNWLLGG